MKIFDVPRRPLASFSCFFCRSVVEIEVGDIDPELKITVVNCPCCDKITPLESSYMLNKLRSI